MSEASAGFEVLEVLDAGTFGTVCVAQELAHGRLVALKVLKASHARRPRVVARIRDEARLLEQLDHPGILRAFGLHWFGDRPVVAMEWVRGRALHEILTAHGGPLSPWVAIDLVVQAHRALHAAYGAPSRNNGAPLKLVHRDIKPANLLVSVEGRLKVVDFGIAKVEMEDRQAETLSVVLGARGYLAPERLDGQEDHPSGDVYALGVTLIELLSLQHVEMSLARRTHEQGVHWAVQRMETPGLDAQQVAQLRQLATELCHYEPSQRPTHEAAADRLDRLAPPEQRSGHVSAFGAERVHPLFVARSRVRLQDWPERDDLAFLAQPAGAKPSAEPDVNAALRDLLRSPGARSRLPEVQRLLELNPHWTPHPFLEQIPTSAPRWWRFWERQDYSSADLWLHCLTERRHWPEVRRRAEALLHHPDPAVARAAASLLTPAEPTKG